VPAGEAIIRQGIRPDGTSVLAMPSASFAIMTDQDLSAILAFIESYPKQDQDLGRSRFGLLPRIALMTGEYLPAAAEVKTKPWSSGMLKDPLKLGEYFAINACSECHGLDFAGNEGFTPPLTITQGYDLADFQKLMATGVGLGERDLGLMSTVAKYRFSRINEQEIQALHQFLQSL